MDRKDLFSVSPNNKFNKKCIHWETMLQNFKPEYLKKEKKKRNIIFPTRMFTQFIGMYFKFTG